MSLEEFLSTGVGFLIQWLLLLVVFNQVLLVLSGPVLALGVIFYGLTSRGDPRLWRELELLVHDRKTAQRLVKGIKQRHRRRSWRWCQEKALNDLRRDRRA